MQQFLATAIAIAAIGASAAQAGVSMPQIPFEQTVDFTIWGTGTILDSHIEEPIPPDMWGPYSWSEADSYDGYLQLRAERFAFLQDAAGVAVDIKLSFTTNYTDADYYDPLIKDSSISIIRRDTGAEIPYGDWGVRGYDEGQSISFCADYGVWWTSCLVALTFDLANPGGSFDATSYVEDDGGISGLWGTWGATRIVSQALGHDTAADAPAKYSTSSVSGVPEPASWGMLIAGFGLIGLAVRRQSRARAALS